MANKVQRIGFIGISGRGSGMLDLLLQVEGVKVPAVCDLVVERAEKGIEIVEGRNNKEYPVKAYLDYKEMFQKEELDAVVIATTWITHSRIAVDTCDGLVLTVCNLPVTGQTLRFISVTFKLAQAAEGTDIDCPFQILRLLAGTESAVCSTLIHIQALANLLMQFLIGKVCIFFRLNDPVDIALHAAAAGNAAPTGLHAVTALDPEQGDRQFHLLGKARNRGIDMFRFAAVGSVSFRGHGNGGALPGNTQDRHHCGKITGLLLNGNRCQKPLDDFGNKAVGHNVLRGHKIDRTFESHADKELIKGRLMVKKDQVRALAITPVGFYPDGKFQQCNNRKNWVKDDPRYLVPKFHPLFFLLHIKLLPST